MHKSPLPFRACGDYRSVLENQRYVGFFDDRAEPDEASSSDTVKSEYWLQRWLAIAQSVGINKSEMFNSYYYDEFIAMMDAYNDMHRIDKDSEDGKEYYADEI